MAMHRSRVLFPAPLMPMMPKMSPGAMSRLTSRKAATSPPEGKILVRCSMRMAGSIGSRPFLSRCDRRDGRALRQSRGIRRHDTGAFLNFRPVFRLFGRRPGGSRTAQGERGRHSPPAGDLIRDRNKKAPAAERHGFHHAVRGREPRFVLPPRFIPTSRYGTSSAAGRPCLPIA